MQIIMVFGPLKTKVQTLNDGTLHFGRKMLITMTRV